MVDNTSEGAGPETAVARELDIESETAKAIDTLLEESREILAEIEYFDPDLLFEIIADPGHRYVLTYLLQSDGAVTLGELVDYVTSRTEHTMHPEVFRERVVAKLTNTYLPNLDESGYVTYNMERQLVGPTELTPLARPYLLVALAHVESAESDDET